MRQAGEALEENGYDVVDYHAFIREQNSGIRYANHADNPGKALDATLDEISEEDILVNIDGADLAEMARGQGDLSQALYQTVNGGISIDEPTVTKEEWTGEAPAFGTIIHYTPQDPDDYFTIGTSETMPPYTMEDAHNQVNDIQQILEAAGLETEEGHIG
ncbi:hypothetical protein V9T20_11680 (plasmid) [Halobacterium salinarum]|uniref:hypothetical protein n=2 Tax=Halobacteriaceae TaxID=2236 RepID=UPI00298BD2C7|nr:hypothetical protein [Halobacterium salinarum]